MNYEEYEANHKGKTFDVYDNEGHVIYEALTPTSDIGTLEFEGMELFAFQIGEGPVVTLPVTSVIKLSDGNYVEAESTI